MTTSTPTQLLRFVAAGGTLDADDLANYSPADRQRLTTAAGHIAELRESGANGAARRHAFEAAASIDTPTVKTSNTPAVTAPADLAALVRRNA